MRWTMANEMGEILCFHPWYNLKDNERMWKQVFFSIKLVSSLRAYKRSKKIVSLLTTEIWYNYALNSIHWIPISHKNIRGSVTKNFILSSRKKGIKHKNLNCFPQLKPLKRLLAKKGSACDSYETFYCGRIWAGKLYE